MSCKIHLTLPALSAAAILLLLCGPAAAQTSGCATQIAGGAVQIPLSGHPFAAIPTADGCHIFVSLMGNDGATSSHIAVLANTNGSFAVVREIKAQGALTGMALSPDGRFLAAANGVGVTLFDAAKLASDDGAPQLGFLNDGTGVESIYTAFSRDGHLLFVSDERGHGISVHDFNATPGGQGDKLIGHIRTGEAPVGLAVSPDGKLLYSTSQSTGPTPSDCADENGNGRHFAQGELAVIDIARAATDPEGAVLRRVPAGCNPVRVALSAAGDIAYVTARGENAVEAFDTAKLLAGDAAAMTVKMKVGVSPVGVAVAGTQVFVTNSDRFGGNRNQSVSVLNAGSLTKTASDIPAGGFPRELYVMPGGKALLITNFASNTLEIAGLNQSPAP